MCPDQWKTMLGINDDKRLPQLHVDTEFFGYFDELQRLDEVGQLVMYLKNPHVARLMSILLDSSTVLEAFGNAATGCNFNSSRFTKYMTFDLDRAGRIHGGHITSVFLEDSRVVSVPTEHESNFHVFYLLLAGVSEELATELELQSEANYNYLGRKRRKVLNCSAGQTYTHDQHEFERLTRSLDVIGLTAHEKLTVFRILSAVLSIGNIEIQNDSVLNSEIVATVGRLLDLSPELIEQLFFSEGESKALQTRDKLARRLYQSVFHWIIRLINRSCLNSSDVVTRSLEILDFSGFQILETNSLDQLCINYLSEKFFELETILMIEKEMDIYEEEGIPWPEFTTQKLESCSEIIEEGIFPLLDQKSFLSISHPAIKTVPDTQNFIVSHHRSPVTYSADEFMMKNSNSMELKLLELLSHSSNKVLQQLLSDVDRPQSLVTGFRQKLDELLSRLSDRSTVFVHCLRPNDEMKPGEFNSDLVEKQVTSHALDRQIELRRQGFSYHELYVDFWQTYGILSRQSESDVKFPQAVDQLLSDLPLDESNSIGSYSLGKSSVFIRHRDAVSALNQFRDERLGQMITRIQALCRGYLCRAKCRRVRNDFSTNRRKLQSFYAQYNPDNLDRVDELLEKYEGRVDVLFDKLNRKYDVDNRYSTRFCNRPSVADMNAIADRIQKIKFTPELVHQLLLDHEISKLTESTPEIMESLHEISEDPAMIHFQIENPQLFEFYTLVDAFVHELSTPALEEKAFEPIAVVNAPVEEKYSDLSLDQAIIKMINTGDINAYVNDPVWEKLFQSKKIQTVLKDVEQDPDLVYFHLDDRQIIDTFQALSLQLDGISPTDIKRTSRATNSSDKSSTHTINLEHVELVAFLSQVTLTREKIQKIMEHPTLSKALNNSQVAQAFEDFIDHPTSVIESLLDLTTADFFHQLRDILERDFEF